MKCYDVKDLAEMLGVGRASVYELLKRREFRWVLVGGKYRISKSSFDNWLNDGEVEAGLLPPGAALDAAAALSAGDATE